MKKTSKTAPSLFPFGGGGRNVARGSFTFRLRYPTELGAVSGAKPLIRKWFFGNGTRFVCSFRRSAFSGPEYLRGRKTNRSNTKMIMIMRPRGLGSAIACCHVRIDVVPFYRLLSYSSPRPMF